MASYVKDFVEGLATDYATDKWNDYAGEKLQPTKGMKIHVLGEGGSEETFTDKIHRPLLH